MKRVWIPQAISGVLLLWAVNPENPYEYYILLRWICCAAFAYLTVQAYSLKKDGWVWILGFVAVLYNPIVSVHLSREIWSVVNLVTIAIAAASVFVLRTPNASAAVQAD